MSTVVPSTIINNNNNNTSTNSTTDNTKMLSVSNSGTSSSSSNNNNNNTNQKPQLNDAVSSVALTTVFKTVSITILNILKTLNPVAGITTTKALSLNLRKEIFKIVDIRKYSRPPSSEEAMKRVRSNLNFFKLIYSAVPIMFIISFVLGNPTLFLSIIACLALWSSFFALGPDKIWKIGSISLGRSEKLTFLGTMTVIIVVFGGLITYAIYVMFGSALVIIGHAIIKEPIQIDPLEELENEGAAIVGHERSDIV